jgi:hypothetical protein
VCSSSNLLTIASAADRWGAVPTANLSSTCLSVLHPFHHPNTTRVCACGTCPAPTCLSLPW